MTTNSDPFGQPAAFAPYVHTAGRTFETPLLQVPGIGTGAAYASGDAVGTPFTLSVPQSGIIQSSRFYDLSAQSAAMELWCFRQPFTLTADNSAWAPADVDVLNGHAFVITMSTYKTSSNNSIAADDGLGISYIAPQGVLYCQFVTRGTPTIASGNLPSFALLILPD